MRRFSAGLRSFAPKLYPRRQRWTDALLPFVQRWSRRDLEQHPIYPASRAKSALRGRNVHEDEPTRVARVLENSANLVVACLIVDLQAQRVAGLSAQVFAHPDRRLVGGLQRALTVSDVHVGSAKIVRMFSHQIEADERNGLTVRGDNGVALDARMNGDCVRQGCEGAHDVVRHSANGDDFEISSCRRGFRPRSGTSRRPRPPASSMASTTATPKATASTTSSVRS